MSAPVRAMTLDAAPLSDRARAECIAAGAVGEQDDWRVENLAALIAAHAAIPINLRLGGKPHPSAPVRLVHRGVDDAQANSGKDEGDKPVQRIRAQRLEGPRPRR